MILYHGSNEIVIFPEIRQARFHKDFFWGFYCTNYYEYTPNDELLYKNFPEMTEEWLDFVIDCRRGKPHRYDIVEGPMADDTIYNYLQDYMDGRISRAAFWELAKFKYPTHQLSFHTVSALNTLKFIGSEAVDGSKK